MHIIVTGGCGFIGSALVRHLMEKTDWSVTNIDLLTYAAQTSNVAEAENNPRYTLAQADIADPAALDKIFSQSQPDGLIHLAAESHVDRSIDGPDAFLRTNILGTYELLQATRRYLSAHSDKKTTFRFHHVSTDEVFGALSLTDPAFTEQTPYDPRSPYSATKAASDHLVSAWYHTFGLNIVMSNCSNNYGPYQYPEKLIPATILRAISGQPVNVYGKGENIRDWIHVDDHVSGLLTVFQKGQPGQSYNIGGYGERKNLDVVHAILSALDDLQPRADGHSYAEQITFVTDRPGHDFRYAINPTRMKEELGWQAAIPFAEGIRATVAWYLANQNWWHHVAEEATRRVGTNIIPLHPQEKARA